MNDLFDPKTNELISVEKSLDTYLPKKVHGEVCRIMYG